MVYRIREVKGDTNSKILMYLPDCTTYEEAKDNTYKFMGHENSKMPMIDIYSDVDASNISRILLKKFDITHSINLYYKEESDRYVKRRFTNFVLDTNMRDGIYPREAPIANFREVVDFYTQKVEGRKEWPLIKSNMLKGAKLESNVRRGIRDGFVQFIEDRLDEENK